MLLLRSVRYRWVLALTVVVVATIGGAGAYWASKLPTAAQQLPPQASSMLVTLRQPLDRSSYPLNSYIPVEAKAIGAGALAALELWVDGSRVERTEVPAQKGGAALSPLPGHGSPRAQGSTRFWLGRWILAGLLRTPTQCESA